MSDWKPGERDYRISADAGKVHWNEGYCNEACRPVVVIDPEDSRGAAVEIAQSVGSALNVMPGRDISAGIKAAQDAIARLATPTPPKPEEPTGLGAVVEDVDGKRWVRSETGQYPWTDQPDPADLDEMWEARLYADIAAVRVLSEGVTP